MTIFKKKKEGKKVWPQATLNIYIDKFLPPMPRLGPNNIVIIVKQIKHKLGLYVLPIYVSSFIPLQKKSSS